LKDCKFHLALEIQGETIEFSRS